MAQPRRQCRQSRWQRVNLGGPVDSVQLALTPAGKPRILAIGPDDETLYTLYWYGECDAQCLSADSWQFVHVTSVYDTIDLTGYYLPERSFALDPQGRPRFVFNNTDYLTEPDLYGGYYAACDSGCLDAGNWSVTRFTHQLMDDIYLLDHEAISSPSLTFTTDGRPRVVAHLFAAEFTGDENGVYYFACDAGCEDDANWKRAWVFERGGGPYPFWDIAVDKQNRPRIAVYKEGTLDDTGRRLYYLSCDAQCESSGSWSAVNLGLPQQYGDGVDLELDAQGRPRMAYMDGSDNLRYSWCDAGCTAAENWQHGVVDLSSDLEAEYPVARPVTCDAGLWDTYAPALALDAQGNPRIVYDGSYKARCQYVDPNDPTDVYDRFHEIWHSVRLVAFAQP